LLVIYTELKSRLVETSAYKIHTPGNYPEENIKHFDICLRKNLEVQSESVSQYIHTTDRACCGAMLHRC